MMNLVIAIIIDSVVGLATYVMQHLCQRLTF